MWPNIDTFSSQNIARLSFSPLPDLKIVNCSAFVPPSTKFLLAICFSVFVFNALAGLLLSSSDHVFFQPVSVF